MRVAAVILAAGSSSRLGEPKQLVRLAGEKLLERAVRIADEADCDPIVVILGASAETILEACDLSEAVVVINADWEEGMASTIACGIAAIDGEADAAIVMACDQPAVTAQHLRSLSDGGDITASGYAGRRGVPAFFPAESFEDLMDLQGDQGARDLLKTARVVELPGGELDVDTPATLAAVRQLYGA